MKELNQKGGIAMFDCKYEKDVRDYCDHGTLGNVSVKSFVYDEAYGEFGDKNLAKLLQ